MGSSDSLDQKSNKKEYAINSDMKVRADAKILDYANFSAPPKKSQSNISSKLEVLELIKDVKEKINELKINNLDNH